MIRKSHLFATTVAGVLALVTSPQMAMAHLGHVGELAGHSHWLGLGALAAAAAAIALLPKGRKKDEDAAEEETAQEAGEAAGDEEAA